jgi:hypothetical protein
MTENKKVAKMDQGKEILRKTGVFLLRWFYLILFLGVMAYAVWIWNKIIFNTDWSAEKKQAYISEQSVFSFDNKSYQQVTDLINLRKERLNSSYRFTGKDIFFPDGF